jgi:hypothetical protein
MQRRQATQRRWSPPHLGPSGRAGPGRRTARRAGSFGGRRGRPATSSARFGLLHQGERQAARRGKQPSGSSPVALARGLFGALGKSKASRSAKRSRRGPALIAVLGGLGAAGAAAFKRRQSARSQPQVDEKVDRSAPDAPSVTQTPPVQSA